MKCWCHCSVSVIIEILSSCFISIDPPPPPNPKSVSAGPVGLFDTWYRTRSDVNHLLEASSLIMFLRFFVFFLNSVNSGCFSLHTRKQLCCTLSVFGYDCLPRSALATKNMCRLMGHIRSSFLFYFIAVKAAVASILGLCSLLPWHLNYVLLHNNQQESERYPKGLF